LLAATSLRARRAPLGAAAGRAPAGCHAQGACAQRHWLHGPPCAMNLPLPMHTRAGACTLWNDGYHIHREPESCASRAGPSPWHAAQWRRRCASGASPAAAAGAAAGRRAWGPPASNRAWQTAPSGGRRRCRQSPAWHRLPPPCRRESPPAGSPAHARARHPSHCARAGRAWLTQTAACHGAWPCPKPCSRSQLHAGWSMRGVSTMPARAAVR